MSYQHEALVSPDVCTLRFATTPSVACHADSQIMFAKAVGTKAVLYQRAAGAPGIGERNAAARQSFEVSVTWYSTQDINQLLGPLGIKGCPTKSRKKMAQKSNILYYIIPCQTRTSRGRVDPAGSFCRRRVTTFSNSSKADRGSFV